MQSLRSTASPARLRSAINRRAGNRAPFVVSASLTPLGGHDKNQAGQSLIRKVADAFPSRRQPRGHASPGTPCNGGAPPRLPPPRSGGGGGGGGGDDSGEPGKKRRFGWKGWDERVQADPQFVYKVLVEQIIGVSASVIGDMSTRPNWGLNELDFVFSTLIVGSIMNFSLMYLLAPTVSVAGAAVSKNLFLRLFDERTLTAMGAPGGHIFEAGYSLRGRLTNLLFKSFTFGLIGFAAGVFGTTTSNTLIKVRAMADPNFKVQNQTPDVFLNALAWTTHMGLSSNIRYQTLNGLEAVLVRVMPPAVFKILVVLLRTANNVLGGMSFVVCARLIGSQKENKPTPVSEPPVVEAGKKLKKK